MDRKLSAILAADVVGYSALMEADEKGTHERLKAGRKELFEPEIARHHGRVFKLMGDGMLAEFGSVVDAVECAVSLQRGLAERNADVAEDKRIQVRIGVNLGEVIVEGKDRFGEGVNIAARLEQLAEPGGIWVSGKVAREVEKKLAFGFEPMGAQRVKNIAEPVEAFRVKLDGMPAKLARRSRPSELLSGRRIAALLAVVAILIAFAALGPGLMRTELVASLLGGRPSVPVSEEGIPIVVVLPFEDLTGGQVQSGLGKGIAEQFITDLSTFPDFEVVSSTSSFAYAGTPVPQIVKATGARFIVEGSIRLVGERVSVTVQLINGSTDRHLKTIQFEETMTDPVSLQKSVVRRIRDDLGGMTGVLRKENEKIAFAKAEADLDEYDYYILGHVHSLKDQGEPAREVWERGLRRFPESVLLRYKLMTYQLGFQNAVEPAEALFAEAQKFRKRSRLDEWYFHIMSAKLLSAKGDHARAVTEARAAIAIAPYDALTHNYLSWVLINARLFDEAIEWATYALDHDPYAPDWYADAFVNAYSNKMKWSEAIALAEPRTRDSSSANRLWYSVLGTAYVRTGQHEKASQAYKIFNSLSPPKLE